MGSARNVQSVPDSVESLMPRRRSATRIGGVTLAEWLDEYRSFSPESVVRPVAEPEDDWEEQDLFADPDRPRDTTPRWRERAERVGYGRLTSF
jgi:hypothetical protein